MLSPSVLSPSAHRTAPRRSTRTFTAYHFLAIYLALLFIIPARLIVPGMGASGSPATLFGVVGFVAWLLTTVVPGLSTTRRFNPVRAGLYAYLLVLMLSWAVGQLRPLTALESSNSDRSMILIISAAGIALIAMDGIRNLQEIERLVRWTLLVSMVMVFVGLVQFFFRYDLSTFLRLPGLEAISAPHLETRSIFNRPFGTTLHPIEYGVVSAALVPFAYWWLRRRPSPSAWIMLFAVGFAALTSISRSAVLTIVVALLVLLAGIRAQQRVALILGTGVMVVIAGVLVDGLIGTLRSLFSHAEEDPSVEARLERWPATIELLAERPWLGRGYGTYTPTDYFLLDNEIHKSAIETGLIGIGVLVFFICIVAAVGWKVRIGSEVARLPGTCLTATMLGLFVSSYTFDAFFYRILTGLLYLSIGLIGAMYRLTAAERQAVDRQQLAHV